MKSVIVRVLIVALTCLALGACDTISEKRKIDYRSARTLPPLEVPPDLTAIPQTNPATGTQPSTATYSEFATEKKTAPADALSTKVLPQITEMHIERDSQARWLVVQAAPEALWPKVREFVSSSGLVIDRENAAAGTLETDWAENHAKIGSVSQRFFASVFGTLYSSGTRDKFRFRLERGALPGTTEIYVAHRGLEEILVPNEVGAADDKKVRWQPRPPEPDAEVEMLSSLMVFLSKTENTAKTAVGQAPVPPVERAHLTHRGDTVFLSLEESLDRAWRRVGLSLDRIGFTVEDRDRSKGIYYVRYIDPDKGDSKPGFFSRLFGAEEKKNNEQYQIHLQTADSGTDVAVKNKDGAPQADKTGERILSLLYQQLK